MNCQGSRQGITPAFKDQLLQFGECQATLLNLPIQVLQPYIGDAAFQGSARNYRQPRVAVARNAGPKIDAQRQHLGERFLCLFP